MLNVKFTEEDLELLNVLLTKEEAEIKIEIHHSRNHDYKEFLKGRERQVVAMLNRLKEGTAVPT